jgi:hypothetical protein
MKEHYNINVTNNALQDSFYHKLNMNLIDDMLLSNYQFY